MRGVIAGAAFACALALTPTALADNVVLYPNASGAHTVASWRAQEGQPDTVGVGNQALWLEKDDGDSAAFAAATVVGLEGHKVQSLTGLAWVRRIDGDCNKLAPRWTLVVQGRRAAGSTSSGLAVRSPCTRRAVLRTGSATKTRRR